MKTSKVSILALLATAAAGLTGCLVTSVCPFYTANDLKFEPGLIGTWTKVGEPNEEWKFEAKGARGYELTVTSKDSTNVMQARLFGLAGQSFLDLFTAEEPENIQPPPIPSHFLLRVFQTKPTVRMAVLNYDWLTSTLEKEPKALRHHIIKTEEKPDNGRVVLTADTPELQRFVIQHLQTTEAWKDDFELQRGAAGSPTQEPAPAAK